MSYKLHIFGEVGKIKEERLHFETLANTVESVEGRCTDDHDGWEFKDGNLTLVDFNNGGLNVIHTIEQSPVDKTHVEIHEGPVYSAP